MTHSSRRLSRQCQPLPQDIEDAALSRAASDDVESIDTLSETGGSPVSSMTGGSSFWPPPVRVGFGGLRAHSGLNSFRRRSSAAGGHSAFWDMSVMAISRQRLTH